MTDLEFRPIHDHEWKYSGYVPRSDELRKSTGWLALSFFESDVFFPSETPDSPQSGEDTRFSFQTCLFRQSKKYETLKRLVIETMDVLKCPGMPFFSKGHILAWCASCHSVEDYGRNDAKALGSQGMRVGIRATVPITAFLRFNSEPECGRFRVRWMVYQSEAFDAHVFGAEHTGIPFVDKNDNLLFTVPDGGLVRVVDRDGREMERRHCRYVDGSNFLFGDTVTGDKRESLHPIHGFLEEMSRKELFIEEI